MPQYDVFGNVFAYDSVLSVYGEVFRFPLVPPDKFPVGKRMTSVGPVGKRMTSVGPVGKRMMDPVE